MLYFEYPRKRSGSSKPISGGTAATIISGIIDRVNDDIATSEIATRNPDDYKAQNELLILQMLKNYIKPFGGRVTKESMYPNVPISKFGKSVWPAVCQ